METDTKKMNRNDPARPSKQSSKPEELLTVEDVAAKLGVSTTKVYRMIRSGQLEAVNLGRLYRITPEAYQRMIDRLSGNVCGRL